MVEDNKYKSGIHKDSMNKWILWICGAMKTDNGLLV